LVYENLIGRADARFPFVRREPVPGNFSPHSATWNLQIEQPVGPNLKLRAGYLSNQASDLVILNPEIPADPASPGDAAMVLSGNGRSRYRQFELTARVRLGEDERQLFLSYVHSRALQSGHRAGEPRRPAIRHLLRTAQAPVLRGFRHHFLRSTFPQECFDLRDTQ
jgi:hypothetical protein